uniref:HEPN domain-containing protein n=2 Tax=viral metagenome TaxID=1070528 RepID=A0A6M3LMS9_9ZZZZ
MEKIEFNNGFIIAITLFLEHKNQNLDLKEKGISDLRLYGATDHLFDLEIPKTLPINLQKRIKKARDKAFHLRLANEKDYSIADKIFKEFEDILIKIDEQIFKTKKIKVNYR